MLYEYWVVATRPVKDNGLGMTVEEVQMDVMDWIEMFDLRDDESGIFPIWLRVVSDGKVMGKIAHDSRLVAAMERHGLTEIMTFNKADFARFPAIKAISPAEVSAGI